MNTAILTVHCRKWILHRLQQMKRAVKNIFIEYKIRKLNYVPAADLPFFTVVIPIYDRVDVVREAIQSILQQSFLNFELLLICDASPPDTMEVVDKYSDHPQVRIFRFSENSGNPCKGRNKGIRMARGEFLLFLDSDDVAVPIRLERTLFHLFDKKVDVVGGTIQYIVEDESEQRFANGQLGFTSEECTYEMLQEGNRLSICTVAVRVDCLKKYGGFREEMRYREDHELWLRLAFNGCRFYNAPETFAKYRVHGENAEMKYLSDDQHWFDRALELHNKQFSNWLC